MAKHLGVLPQTSSQISQQFLDQSLKFSTEGKNRFYYRYTEKKLTYNLNSISAIPTVPAPQVVDQEDIKDNNKTFRLDRVVKFIITIRDVFKKKCLEADSQWSLTSTSQAYVGPEK